MSMFTPRGFTNEGTLTSDSLHAGDHPIRTQGVTLKASLRLSRGTLVYLKDGQTQYEVYDGGTITEGSLMGILVDDVYTEGGAASVAVYIAGDFNTNKITIAEGGSLATVRDRLILQSLYLCDPFTG